MKLNDERGGEPDSISEPEPGLHRVPLETPTLPPATRTNTYIAASTAGWIVVDIGPADPAALAPLLRLLDRLGRFGPRIAGLLLTHHHRDHRGGLNAWWREIGCPVFASAETWARVDSDPGGDAPEGERRVVRGGDRIGELAIVETPGHARGHLSLRTWKGSLLAGDLVSGIGTVVIDPPDGDMGDYIETLDRLLAGPDGAVYPAHGPGFAAGHDRLAAVRAHRLAREEQVLAAVPAGGCALDEITERTYADVPGAPLLLARRSALAHLVRLERLGQVAREGADRWKRG